MDQSLHAHVCDLLGEDPSRPHGTPRPTVGQAAKQCPVREVMAARFRGRKFAVARTEAGDTYVVPDRCPHDGGRLSDGFVEGGKLVCSRHGWEFDLETGECTGRPHVKLDVKPLSSPAQ